MVEPAEIQARRMDLVSRWADDLAHEIKNPLHAMVINLELVKRRAGSADTSALVDRVEVLESELHRVHTLIESLLRLVRPWTEHGFADAERVFRDIEPVVDVRARIRKIQYQHEVCPAAVAMPAGRLTLVLLDLVDRAIENTRSGGRITTTCQLEQGRVRITIHDTGDPDQDPVERAPGLGLALARRLVEDAGGEMTAEAAPDGVGTRMTLLLPRADAA
jgi:signal transduction histidine kinase